MGRAPRIDLGGHVYHILNRANGRGTLFEKEMDYLAFEQILRQAQVSFPRFGGRGELGDEGVNNFG